MGQTKILPALSFVVRSKWFSDHGLVFNARLQLHPVGVSKFANSRTRFQRLYCLHFDHNLEWRPSSPARSSEYVREAEGRARMVGHGSSTAVYTFVGFAQSVT